MSLIIGGASLVLGGIMNVYGEEIAEKVEHKK
jgi:hypothetical protein